MTTTGDITALAALRERMDGPVVLPGEPAWDQARRAWNLVADQRPVAVAIPASADEVAAVVRFAGERGLRVAPQSTGHGAAPMGSLEGAILLRTTRLAEVRVDTAARAARIGAGVNWRQVVGETAPHGLSPLAGSSPGVGAVGYTLGGGLGWLGRRFGLACNAVRAAEVVTGDGRRLRVDAGHEPDLFWALRGGGGSFAVVTALEIELFEVPSLYGGLMMWPWERAAEVLHAWREWASQVDEHVTSSGRLLQVPPIPAAPAPLRGRAFAVVEAACIGDAAAGEAAMAPLRALGPEVDTFAPMGPDGLGSIHMDPEEPVPGIGDHALLREITPAAVDALVAVAGPGSGSPLVSVELRQAGGALARGGPGHGAFDRLDAGAAMFAVGMAVPGAAPAIDAHLAALCGALAPHATGGQFLNFAEQPRGVDGMFPPATLARLRDVRARYDERGVLQANHPVGAG